MMEKEKSKKVNQVLELWRKTYCFVIPLIITGAYLFAFLKYGFCIWDSKNFGSTLTSIITFVSIIISFFGVLLTILISAREKSELINYFLRTADKGAFIRAIRELIICGLSTVIIAALLFGYDILQQEAIVCLVLLGIFCLIRFSALTYRFTNILLMLFVGEKKSIGKREGKTISAEELDKLNRIIK